MKDMYLGEMTGKVLFLGDSITDDGKFLSFLHTYFALFLPDYDITFYNLGVSSENLSGLSEEEHPFPRPCLFGRLDRVLELVRPQWVVSLYGINDGIYSPFSQDFFERFQAGYLRLAAAVEAAGAQLVACTPIPFDVASYTGKLEEDGQEQYGFEHTYCRYNDVMQQYAQWIREEIPLHARSVVDLFAAVTADWQARRAKDPGLKTGDGIHPDLNGHLVVAQTLLRELFGLCAPDFADAMRRDRFRLFRLVYGRDRLFHSFYKETAGHDNLYKDRFLPADQLDAAVVKRGRKIEAYLARHRSLRGGRGRWKGFRCERFNFEGNPAVIVFPKHPLPDGQWIWRTEFFGSFPGPDVAMLKRGYTLFHLSIPDQFGSPCAVAQMERFRAFVTQRYRLHQKGILFGLSRGGLYALHYAAANPGAVQALYLDAPVVDIRSWPLGMGSGEGSAPDAALCLRAFGLESPEEYQEILDGMLDAVTAARIPLILVAGGKDTVVPYEENGLFLQKRWQAQGIRFSLIFKPDCGHHPHGPENPDEIALFFMAAEG